MSVGTRSSKADPAGTGGGVRDRSRERDGRGRKGSWSGRRTLWTLLALGGAGVVAAYPLAGTHRFWANWVLWFVFMVCLALGALFLVALQHITGAMWSVPLRRAPERIAVLTPWLVPVGIVALFSLPVLFSWTQPNAASITPIVLKSHWLNYPFFIIRLVACLALWVLSYLLLVKRSTRQDRTKDPNITVRLRFNEDRDDEDAGPRPTRNGFLQPAMDRAADSISKAIGDKLQQYRPRQLRTLFTVTTETTARQAGEILSALSMLADALDEERIVLEVTARRAE